MRMTKWLSVLVLSFAVGCGAADLGEECEKSGDQEECVEEAICTSVGDSFTCLKRCTDDAQCSATEACNGVSGTNIKSCQAK